MPGTTLQPSPALWSDTPKTGFALRSKRVLRRLHPLQPSFRYLVFIPCGLGLIHQCLLSATLLPGSSEALLLLRLDQGAPWVPVVLTATAGNLLGSLLTYGWGVPAMSHCTAAGCGSMKMILRVPRAGFGDGGSPRCCWPGCRSSAIRCAWWPACCGSAHYPSWCLVGLGKLARYGFLAWAVV